MRLTNFAWALVVIMLTATGAFAVDKVFRDHVLLQHTLEVDGAATFNGNMTLGDAASDTLTVTATLQGASPLVFEGATANAYETTIAVADPTADNTLTLPDASGTLACTGADFQFSAGLTGGADISVASAAAGTAGSSLDLASGAGGTAATNSDGQAGGVLSITGGAGTVKNGSGTNDGSGGDVVLLGGAKGGATGSAVDGIVRVGSPTVGSSKTTNLLAVAGGFEVDGAARFDGTVAFNSTTTFQAGDIAGTEIADVTRSIPLPLHAWVPCADGVWDASGTDAKPDFATVNTALVIEYDATGGSVDTGEICTSFTVPADYVSGGSFVARVTQGGATVTNLESFSCRISVDGASIGAANSADATNQTAVQSVTSTPAGTWAVGASIGVACKQGNASADDAFNIHSIEARYTAAQ